MIKPYKHEVSCNTACHNEPADKVFIMKECKYKNADNSRNCQVLLCTRIKEQVTQCCRERQFEPY